MRKAIRHSDESQNLFLVGIKTDPDFHQDDIIHSFVSIHFLFVLIRVFLAIYLTTKCPKS